MDDYLKMNSNTNQLLFSQFLTREECRKYIVEQTTVIPPLTELLISYFDSQDVDFYKQAIDLKNTDPKFSQKDLRIICFTLVKNHALKEAQEADKKAFKK